MADLFLSALLCSGIIIKITRIRWLLQVYLIFANVALGYFSATMGFTATALAFLASVIVAGYYAGKEYWNV